MGGLVPGEDKEGVVGQGEDGNGVRRVGLKSWRGGLEGGWRRNRGGESDGRRPKGGGSWEVGWFGWMLTEIGLVGSGRKEGGGVMWVEDVIGRG